MSIKIRNSYLKNLLSKSKLDHDVGYKQFPGMSEILQQPVHRKKKSDIKKCNTCLKEFKYVMQLENNFTENDCSRKLSPSEITNFKKKPKYYLVDLLRKQSVSKKKCQSQVPKIVNDSRNIDNNFESKHSMEAHSENDIGLLVNNLPEDSISSFSPPCEESQKMQKYLNHTDTGIERKMITKCNTGILDTEIKTESEEKIIGSSIENSGAKIKVELEAGTEFNIGKPVIEIKAESETITEFNSEISVMFSEDYSGNCVELSLNSKDVKFTTERDVIKEIYKETGSNSTAVTDTRALFAVPEEHTLLSDTDCLNNVDINIIGASKPIGNMKSFNINQKLQKKEKSKKRRYKKSKTDIHNCMNCGLSYSSKNDFLKHKEICRIISKTEFSKGMVYNCTICHACFKFQNNLLRHLQIHMDKDSYE